MFNMYEIINHCIFSEIDPFFYLFSHSYIRYTYIYRYLYIILLCIVYMNIRSQTKLLQSATHCYFIRNEMIIILQQKRNRFYLFCPSVDSDLTHNHCTVKPGCLYAYVIKRNMNQGVCSYLIIYLCVLFKITCA